MSTTRRNELAATTRGLPGERAIVLLDQRLPSRRQVLAPRQEQLLAVRPLHLPPQRELRGLEALHDLPHELREPARLALPPRVVQAAQVPDGGGEVRSGRVPKARATSVG